MRAPIFLFLCLSISCFPACGLFQQQRIANPVLVERFNDSDGSTAALITTSDRRVVLINGKTGRSCMEPPPDATENVSANLGASLAAAAPAPSGVDASVKGQTVSQVASALAHVTQPAQGILLYRVVLSNLCNEYANGVIDAVTYGKAAGRMLLIAQQLTMAELILTNGKVGPDTATVPATILPLPNIASSENRSETSKAQDKGKGDGAKTIPTPTPTPGSSIATPPSASTSAATVNALSASAKQSLIEAIRSDLSSQLQKGAN